jgi:hypothetical protein
MVLEIVFYVFLYHCGQFFYRKRGHTTRTDVRRVSSLKNLDSQCMSARMHVARSGGLPSAGGDLEIALP